MWQSIFMKSSLYVILIRCKMATKSKMNVPAMFRAYPHIDYAKYEGLATALSRLKRFTEYNNIHGLVDYRLPSAIRTVEMWPESVQFLTGTQLVDYNFSCKYLLQRPEMQNIGVSYQETRKGFWIQGNQFALYVRDRKDLMIPQLFLPALEEAISTVPYEKYAIFVEYVTHRPEDQDWLAFISRQFIISCSTHPLHPIVLSWLCGFSATSLVADFAFVIPKAIEDIEGIEEEFVQTELPNMKELEDEWHFQSKMKRLQMRKVKLDKRRKNRLSSKLRLDSATKIHGTASYDVEALRRKNLVGELPMNTLNKCLDAVDKDLEEISRNAYYTINDALQLFATFKDDVLKRDCAEECSGAYGDICKILRRNHKIRFGNPSRYMRTPQVVFSYDEMWEHALARHYQVNSHHPEFGRSQMGYAASLECLFDLLASAMRISDNAFEAYKKMKDWLFTWERNIDSSYNWKEVAQIRPKFATMHPGALTAFISLLLRKGVSTSSCKKIHYNVERSSPCGEGEDHEPILAMYNKIIAGGNYPRSFKNRFVQLVKKHKFRSYIRETEWHVTLVDNMCAHSGIVTEHDKQKFDWDSILAYTYKWFIQPTLPNKDIEEIHPSFRNPQPHLDSMPTEIKLILYRMVNESEIEGTNDQSSGFVTRVTSAISRASGIVLSPLSGPINSACEAITNLVNKMDGLIDTVIDKISSFVQKMCGLKLLRKYVNFENISLLLIDYLIFVNTTSMMLKIAVIMHALSVLGILEKVKEIFENLFVEGPETTDGIEETSESPIWSKFVDLLTSADPKICGVMVVIVIGLMLGTSAAKNVKASDFTTKCVEALRNFHFIGGGLLGMDRIFKYLVTAYKVAIDWIRKRLLGLKSNEEKLEEAKELLEKEVCTNLAMLDYYASQEGATVMRTSLIEKQRARAVLRNAYKFLSLARSGKMEKHLSLLYFKAEKKIGELHNTLTRVSKSNAFRSTPFHLQLHGEPGIGKSKLMRAIQYDIWTTYHSSKATFSESIYQPNFDKKHWDGYHGQPILMIDDAFQFLDPEVIMQMILIVNTIPMLLPMANLTDKDECLRAEDIISTTNNPYPRVEKIAQMEAIHRRRHLLVEVTIDPEVMDKTACKFDSLLYFTKYMKLHKCLHELPISDKKEYIRRMLEKMDSSRKMNINNTSTQELADWLEHQAQRLFDLTVDFPGIPVRDQLRYYLQAEYDKDTKFPHLRFDLKKPVVDCRGDVGYYEDGSILPSGVKLPVRDMTYLELMATVHSRRAAVRREENDLYSLQDKEDCIYQKHQEIFDTFSADDIKSMSQWIQNNIHNPDDIMDDILHEDQMPYYMELPASKLDYSSDNYFQNKLFEEEPILDKVIENIEEPNIIYAYMIGNIMVQINVNKRETTMGTVSRPLHTKDLEELVRQEIITQERFEELIEIVGTSDESILQLCAHSSGLPNGPVDNRSYCETCHKALCSICQYNNGNIVPFSKELRKQCKHRHVCDITNIVCCQEVVGTQTCNTCTMLLCSKHLNEPCQNHIRRGYDVVPASIANQYVVSFNENTTKIDKLIKKAGSIENARKKYKNMMEKLEEYIDSLYGGTVKKQESIKTYIGQEFIDMYKDDAPRFRELFQDPINSLRTPIEVKMYPLQDRSTLIFQSSRTVQPDGFDINDFLPKPGMDRIVLLEREKQSPLWKDFMQSKNAKPWYKSLYEKFSCNTPSGRIFAPCECHGNIGSVLPISWKFLEKVEYKEDKWVYKYDLEDMKWNNNYFSRFHTDDKGTPHPMFAHSSNSWWFVSYDYFMNELNEEQRIYLVNTLSERSKAYNYAHRIYDQMKKFIQYRIFQLPSLWLQNIKTMWKHPTLISFRNVMITLALTFGMIGMFRSIASLFKGRKIEETSRVMFKHAKRATVLGTSMNEENLVTGVKNNIVQIEVDGKFANAIGLDGHLIMMNQHVIDGEVKDFRISIQYTGKSQEMFPYLVEAKNVHFIPDTDLAIIYIPEMSPFRKIIHKFRLEEDYTKHHLTNLSVLYRKKGEFHHKTFAPQDICAQFMRNNQRGKKIVNTNVLSYHGDPEHGSSGGVLITDDLYAPRNILGVQCFRDVNGKYGYGNLVFQEELWKVYKKFEGKNIVHDGPFSCVEGTSQCEQLITTQISVEGVVPEDMIAGSIIKGNYFKTPIADDFSSKRIPAILNPFDPRVPEGDHPLAHSFNKVGRDIMQPLDKNILKHCTQQYAQFLSTQISPYYLSFEEVLSGLCEEGNDKINTKTSPGIPWIYKRKKPGKKDFIEFDEEGNLLSVDEEVICQFNYFEENLSNNKVPKASAYEFPKDELRPIEKVLGPPIKTRSISVVNMILNMIWRKYTLSFDAQMHVNARGVQAHCVGINPESFDWTRLYHHLKSKSDVGCDFDVGNWDGHFTMQLALAVAEIYSIVYQDQGEIGDNIRRSLLDSVFGGWFQFGDVVCQKHRGLESGFAGTAEVNTLGHALLFFYFYCEITLKETAILPTWTNFQEHVALKIYGDDIIFSIVPEVATYFNPVSVAARYQFYGWPVTSADKTQLDLALRPIDDLVFLKRKFKLSKQRGIPIVFGALDTDVIEDLRYWIRKTPNMLDQLYSNLRLALEYAFMHGQDYFQEFLEQTNRSLRRNKLELLYGTYETTQSRLLARFVSEG